MDIQLFLSHAAVPYLPTLGPVHPDMMSGAVIKDVLRVATSTDFLPYDKDARWSKDKLEQVLPALISQSPSGTIIPTLAHRGSTCLKLHVYGNSTAADIERASEAARRLHPFPLRIITFSVVRPETMDDTSTIYLATPNPYASSDVTTLDTLAPGIRSTLKDLAIDPDNAGFAFLAGEIDAGRINGPILVTTDQDRITGAIGPLQTAKDANGKTYLLPPYFSVSEEARGQGKGRELWRAAMDWACREGAEYHVFEARAGSPAEAFYASVGTKSLGYRSLKD